MPVQATREAIAALTPVEMATVAVRPDPPLVHRRRVPLEGVGQGRSVFIDAALGVVSGIVVGYFIRRFAVGGGK